MARLCGLAACQEPQTRGVLLTQGHQEPAAFPGHSCYLGRPLKSPPKNLCTPELFSIPNMPEPRGPRRLLLSARLITPNSPSRYCVQAELPPLIAVIFSSACAGGRGDVPGILILHSRLTPAARMRPLHCWLLVGERAWPEGQEPAGSWARPQPSLGTRLAKQEPVVQNLVKVLMPE